MIKNKIVLSMLIVLISTLFGCNKTQDLTASVIEPTCISGQSKCEIKGEHESFWILFNVDPVITETGFEISLKSNTTDRITSISSYMEGKEMFMGKVPLFFNVNDNSNIFTANSLLGSCSDEKMRWIIWFDVIIERKDKSKNHEKFMIEFNSLKF